MSTQAARLNASENNRGRGWKELEGEKEHKRQTMALHFCNPIYILKLPYTWFIFCFFWCETGLLPWTTEHCDVGNWPTVVRSH